MQYDLTGMPPPLPAKIPMMPTDDFFKFRLTGNEEVERRIRKLRGEVEVMTEEGQRIWKQVYPASINDEGVYNIIDILESCGLNKNIILGNLTGDEIRNRCKRLWKDLVMLMIVNGERYEVDRKKRSLIIKSIIYPIHSALSRSELGKESDQISTASQRIETHNSQDQQKKGLLDGLLPRREQGGNQ